MSGLLQKLSGIADDPDLETFYVQDNWITKNTLWRLDVTNPLCFPSQTTPVNGGTLKNLVAGQPDFTIVKSGTGGMGWREKGFDLTGTTGNSIATLNNTDYLLSAAGNPDFLFNIWFKREDTFSASAQTIAGRGTSSTAAANVEFYVNTPSNGIGFNTAISNGTTTVSGNSTTFLADYNTLINTTLLLGIAMEGGVLKIFLNGVLKFSSAGGFTKPYNSPAAPFRIGSGIGAGAFKGIFKAAGLTKLTSKETAAYMSAKDWERNGVYFNQVS